MNARRRSRRVTTRTTQQCEGHLARRKIFSLSFSLSGRKRTDHARSPPRPFFSHGKTNVQVTERPSSQPPAYCCEAVGRFWIGSFRNQSCRQLSLVIPLEARPSEKERRLVASGAPQKAHLIELSELAELVPQIALLARASEVSHPHLRSGYVSHVYLSRTRICCSSRTGRMGGGEMKAPGAKPRG